MKGMKPLICNNTTIPIQSKSWLHRLLYRIGYRAGQAAVTRDDLVGALHAGFEHGYAVRSQAAKMVPASKRTAKRSPLEQATQLAGAVNRG